MRKFINTLIFIALPAATSAKVVSAQVEVPPTAQTSGKQVTPFRYEEPLMLTADLGSRKLIVTRGDSTLKTYSVAVGQPRYPTPKGTFTIRRMVWNPSWHPPPESDWARGKKAKGPGEPGNPMKVVKIFFKEPDYYIHGTDQTESLGDAASHGCLRMDPSDVADLAKLIMEHGGQPRDENWFWRILHSRREEKEVTLDNPVSITIQS
jgi:lipoprotein-anchoring transpeptidase ErfK/SrfK